MDMSFAGLVADHHAHTGHGSYDSIAFSGEPLVQPLTAPGGAVQLFRHLGVEGTTELARSEACHADHDALTLSLRSSGAYRGMVGGERVDKPLRRGQVSFVPAGMPVSIEYPAAHSVLVLYLPHSLTRTVLGELGAVDLQPLHSEDEPQLAQLMRMIERELEAPSFVSQLMIDGLVRAIVTGLCRHDASQPHAGADRIYLPPQKLKRIVDFVESHVDQPIGLNDLAAVAGLSPFHFSRVFKQANGETPCQFVRSRRLERARTLLATTTMALAELALACGFANQSHFTAAFTRATGVSPAKYRRLIGR